MQSVSVWLGIVCLTFWTMSAFGAEEENDFWSGTVELGAVMTTGNTDEENLKFRTNAVRESELWRHTFHVDGLRSSQDDEVTAHRLYSSYQIDRKLNGDSVFGRFSYDDDRFSGFEYRANLTGGYSRELFTNETISITGDVGLGVRHSEFDDGASENELIARLAGAMRWQISETALFEQRLGTEIGQDSTVTRSETSLRSDIIGSLAMKLSFIVRHQSEAPLNTEETDTETSVTIAYKF